MLVQTVSSTLIMITSDKFKLDKNRLNLYYDQYKYRFSLTISEIHYFREIKTLQKYHKRVEYVSNLLSGPPSDLSMINRLVEWRISSDTNLYKIRFHQDRLDMYTNDINVIQSLLNIYDDSETVDRTTFLYSELTAGYKKDVVYQVNPKRKYRIYVKSRRYSHDERERLRNFLVGRVKMSDSFHNWLNKNAHLSVLGGAGFWVWSNYFFDFDDETLISILMLKFDNFVGKVCEIQKKINT